MEGILTFSSRSDMRGNPNVWSHEPVVIMIGIVVGKVEVTVCENTVSYEEIMGLISREVYALCDKDGGAYTIKKKRHHKEENELPSERKRRYPLDDTIEEKGLVPSKQKDSRKFESEDEEKSRKAVELETREEVTRAQVMKTDKGNKQQKKERQVAQEIKRKSLLVRERKRRTQEFGT
jgi:hypothetical protein